MTTTTEPTAYLLDIIDDLEEDPIPLTQADFDQLVSAGEAVERNQETLSASSDEAKVDFATLESVREDGRFFLRDTEIPQEEAARYCELGLREALRLAIIKHEAAQD